MIPQSEFLVDYGGDKRSFLEAVLTYTNVIPALQFGNAGMLFSLSKLLERSEVSRDINEINWIKGNASSIIKDALSFQYNSGGFWNCLNQEGKSIPVRAMSDFPLYRNIHWNSRWAENCRAHPFLSSE